jgi:hypothetical protein
VEDRLSEFLLASIREIDKGGEEECDPKERESDKRFRRGISVMVRHLLGSLEGFADTKAIDTRRFFERYEFLEDLLDDHYSREVLKRVPKMVDRTIKLAQILPDMLPSKHVDLYLKDATRSYIFGLWTASVSLCRAAVERSLRDLIEQHKVDPPWQFKKLVETARHLGLLEPAHAIMAKKVGNIANNVLHGTRLREATAESKAWATLCAARGVLIHLYSARDER